MTAAEKRRLTSSTPHTNQEYWASPLSKGNLTDSNTYHKEYEYIYIYITTVIVYMPEGFQVFLEILFSKAQGKKIKVLIKRDCSSNVAGYSC